MVPARHVSGSGGRPMADSLRNLFPPHRNRPKGNPKTTGFWRRSFPLFLSLLKEMGPPEAKGSGKRSAPVIRNFLLASGGEIFRAAQARPPHPGKKGGPPAGWSSFLRFLPPRGGPHSVMIFRITRSVSRIPSAASTPTWRTVSSTSSPTMPSPERKLSPLRYMS